MLAEQVQSADTCNSYRKTLQRTEKKLADCRQENNFLKERIDIIASSTIVSSGKVRRGIECLLGVNNFLDIDDIN